MDHDFRNVPPPSNFTQQRGNQRLGAPSIEAEEAATASINKKVPFSKPINKNFLNSWNDVSSGPPMGPPPGVMGGPGMPPGPPQGQGPPQGGPFQENVPPGCLSLQELQRQATAIVAFGNVYPVLPGSNLCQSIVNGEMAVKNCLRQQISNY